MDTKKLVVGQEILVSAGTGYGHDLAVKSARVASVMESCVEGPVGLSYRMRFDTNGKAMDSRDVYAGFMNGWGQPCSPTHGTWELTDEKELQRREAEYSRRNPPYPPKHSILFSLRRLLRQIKELLE